MFVKLQPYRFPSLAKRPNEKLSSSYYGSYKVLERIGSIAYGLELPSYSKINNVFHISQLKKLIGPAVQPQPLPTCLEENLELHVQPERVLQSRYSKKGHLEVLLKWKNLPNYENTWEDYDVVRLQFPSFYLEDKVGVIRGVMIDH